MLSATSSYSPNSCAVDCVVCIQFCEIIAYYLSGNRHYICQVFYL